MINNPFFDLYIDEAMDFSMFLVLENVSVDTMGNETVTPVNLTGVTSVTAQVRKQYNSVGVPLLSFSTSITNITGGEISLSLSAAQTSNLGGSSNLPVLELGYYDIVLNNVSGTKSKLVSGKVWLNQTITG